MDVETFYDAIHDDAPLLVARPNNRAYFGGLFSKDGGFAGPAHAACLPRADRGEAGRAAATRTRAALKT